MTMTFYPGMSHLMENTVLNVKDRSLTITAEVEIPGGGAKGVIIAQGRRFAGWSLDVTEGAAKYAHNSFDVDYSYVRGEAELPTGTVNIRYDFNFEGDAPGGGGTGTLYVNNEKVAEGRIGKTVLSVYSADETLDIGGELTLPVTNDYLEGESSQLSGKIYGVRIYLGRRQRQAP